MGLGSIKSAWQRQYKDFGHTNGSKYSCLVFDNRGIGESDKPLMRYSTSEMAIDTLELLDNIGWTEKRQLHIIGISLGGMIAEELGLLIPSRVASLSLVSTTAALKNTTSFFENLLSRINLFVPRPMDTQLNNVAYNLFTDDWLPLPDKLEYTKEPFPTNRDRVMASELSKRVNPNTMTRASFLAQALAAGWHHKSPSQIAELGDKIGRERIMVVHGGKDRMISFPNGEALAEMLGGKEGGITIRFVPEMGHVFPIEMRKAFNQWVEEIVCKGEDLNQQEL
jgi:pimeloyl-ACP methyl ester carboxylesterase